MVDASGTSEPVRYEHVPRERNVEADRLANQGVDEWLASEGSSFGPPPAPPARQWEADGPS